MARNESPRPEGDFGGYADFGDVDGEARARRRRALTRYAVPVAVAAVAATTIGLGTALASTGSGPSLPHLTVRQLLDKMAASDTSTLSGSVRVSTDLGLPSGLSGGLLSGVAGGASGSAGSSAPFSGGSSASGASGPGSSSPSASSDADPAAKLSELLSGTHTLQVAADGPDRQRLSIVDDTSQYTVIHDGTQVWAYDSGANSVYHATEPAHTARTAHAKQPRAGVPATPQAAVDQLLKAAGPTTAMTVDGTARVAGRSAYELLVRPKQADSTIDSVRVAVDSATGTPLAFTLTPKGGGKAAVDIAYTRVDFGKPSASDFTFTVPKGAKVTQGKQDHGERPGGQNGAAGSGAAKLPGGASGPELTGTGWTTIAELKAPSGAAGKSGGGSAGNSPSGQGPAGVEGLLGTLGHHVSGRFGSGTVISTRLVNVLVTDKGAVYAGAVTQEGLVEAANAAAG
ncbi:DUF2092 domain-containing protein [Streptomyces sp. ICBB 8177]|uniref:LolA family protein n=1 Tax=Streptomyces sp. ICBB 8177 TaxID=563922 RepID=UPI000D6843C4|nr:DUF2092 domain-containing protein [Streptomyces sp. ICBB 8177]PWI45507.1 DUF2092 domain-containing protein [Streptomyces sp. ICBB 8177]